MTLFFFCKSKLVVFRKSKILKLIALIEHLLLNLLQVELARNSSSKEKRMIIYDLHMRNLLSKSCYCITVNHIFLESKDDIGILNLDAEPSLLFNS
jgi:hypothetical protein